MRCIFRPLSGVLCLWLCLGSTLPLRLLAEPTLLTWDGTPATVGVIDNTTGSWTNSTLAPFNWYNGSTNQAWDPAAIAQFGSPTSTLGASIRVDEAIAVAGINFLALGGVPTGEPFQFVGTGSVSLGTGATINIATNATSSSGRYVRFSVPVAAHDLTVAKADGSGLAFFDLAVPNASLTGTLTLKASAAGGGVFAVLRPANVTGLSQVIVENGSTLYFSVSGVTFSTPITMAGTTPALRVDSNNNTFTGPITLSGTARFHTNVNVVTTTMTSSITETSGGAKGFTRSATIAANPASLATLAPTTTFNGTSSYTGATTFGMVTSLMSTSDIGEGGTNVLNFAAPTAPEDDMLYNGVTPGALNLIGGTASATVLKMIGAAGAVNSQSFGGLSIQQGGTGIEVVSDAHGTAHLSLGAITRAAATVLTLKGPASGSITASHNASTDIFLGPWATYIAGDGTTAGWAALTGGVVSGYTGDLDHITGTAITGTPGFTAAAHLRISAASTGTITTGGSMVNVATLSMTDAASPRVLDIGSGSTLRLAAVGGIQITQGAQGLTVGAPGDGSILTAGGTATNTAGELILTSMSSAGALTIHSQIRNNGSGALTLILNGTGRTILTGANDFTGHVFIHSGVLEVRHNAALGAASASASLTKIMSGASLNLSGGITLAEGIQVNGHGIALDGAIRSLSGENILSGAVRAQSTTRIAADAGLLTLSGGIITQTTSIALYFSGAGDITIPAAITGATPVLFKDGTGTLTLSGTSVGGGATTVSNGALHLDFTGVNAPATNIIHNGTTPAGLTVGNSSTFRVTGRAAATNSQTFSTLSLGTGRNRFAVDQNGAAGVSVNFTGTITRAVGALVQFDVTSQAGFNFTAATANTLLTGAGGVAFATVSLSDWAAVNASKTVVGLSSLSGGYTTSGLSGNADVTGSTTISADTAVASLRFNTNTGGLLTLGESAANKYLTTGGILVTPEVGPHDILISTGALRAPAGAPDLVIIQNNTQGALRISSRITNNASATPGGTTLVKSGAGALILEAGVIYNQGPFPSAYFTNGVRVHEGTLQVVSTLTNGSTLQYPIYSAGDLFLGSGAVSAKVIVGSGTAPVNLWGGLATDGYGTESSIVAGTSVMSGYTHHRDGQVRDFRRGTIGGAGPNENNLTLTLYSGTLQLGPANTFIGKTIITKGVLEVEKLADTGLASSLGTGDFNAAASVIDLTVGTAGTAGSTVNGTLRHIGAADSVTNRVVNLTNPGTVTNTTYVNGAIENTGAGSLQFTSAFTAGGGNTAQRTLILGGTHTGDNRIVSMADATNVPSAPGVKLQKTGVGTWSITGASTYSGGTTVTAGALLAGNTSMVGSATGSGAVTVAPGATLGGHGRIVAAEDKSITLTGGTLSIGLPSAGSAGVLQIGTSGAGMLSLDQGSTIAFDLFSGIGLDNTSNPAAADLLAVTGLLDLGTGTTLKVSNPSNLSGFTGNEQWQLFDWSGLAEPVTGTFATVDLPVLADGLAWDISQLLTTGVLATMAVPEPSRAVLLLAALGTLALRRRRRSCC